MGDGGAGFRGQAGERSRLLDAGEGAVDVGAVAVAHEPGDDGGDASAVAEGAANQHRRVLRAQQFVNCGGGLAQFGGLWRDHIEHWHAAVMRGRVRRGEFGAGIDYRGKLRRGAVAAEGEARRDGVVVAATVQPEVAVQPGDQLQRPEKQARGEGRFAVFLFLPDGCAEAGIGGGDEQAGEAGAEQPQPGTAPQRGQGAEDGGEQVEGGGEVFAWCWRDAAAQRASSLPRQRPEDEAAGGERGRDVDEVVLPGGEDGSADEQAPEQPRQAQRARQFRPVVAADDEGEDDVQRGRFVVGLVEGGERAEEREEEAVAVRFCPADLQREEQETADGDGLRGEQLRDVAVLFAGGTRQKKAQGIEQVERPVGDYRPRQEGDGAFPGVDDFRHGRALRGEVVGEAVARVEDDGDGGEFEQGGGDGGFVHGGVD